MIGNFKRPKWMRQYHRWLGVLVAFPWIWLAVTGLILRQEENLSLSKKKIYSEFLLKHYGVYPQEEALSFGVAGTKGQVVTLWGGKLYKDGNPLGDATSLKGAVAAGVNLAVATSTEILIYDAQLEFYDSLDDFTLGVSSIDTLSAGDKNAPIIFTSSGKTYTVDKQYLSTKESQGKTSPNAEISKVGTVSKKTMETIQRYYAEDVGIPYSRLILDLHSGNFFGTAGKLLIDISAFLSIILTVLGLLLVKRKWKSPTS